MYTLRELNELTDQLEAEIDNGHECKLRVTYRDGDRGMRNYTVDDVTLNTDIDDVFKNGNIALAQVVEIDVITEQEFTVEVEVTMTMTLSVTATDSDTADTIADEYLDDNTHAFKFNGHGTDNVDIVDADHDQHSIESVRERY